MFSLEVKEQAAVSLWSLAGQTNTRQRFIAEIIGIAMLIEMLLRDSEKLQYVGKCQIICEHRRAWWHIGKLDAFHPIGRGFESRSRCHAGILGKSFTHSGLWRLGMKLWHSVHAVSNSNLLCITLSFILVLSVSSNCY